MSSVEKVIKIINKNFNLSPRGIREMLKLITLFMKLLRHMGTSGENQQIKGNFLGKKQKKSIYSNCNLEKTIIFF